MTLRGTFKAMFSHLTNKFALSMLAAALAPSLLPASPVGVAGVQPEYGADGAVSRGRRQLDASLGRLPLYFIANEGQADERVAFYLNGGDKTVYFSPNGVTYAISDFAEKSSTSTARSDQKSPAEGRWAMRIEYLRARRRAPVGGIPAETVVSYFKGSPARWKTGIATYKEIVYRELWPGIDLVYRTDGSRLKYHFVVRPGADPSDVRWLYHGASVALTSQGTLQVSTPAGGFEDEAPAAWQAGGAVEVAFDTRVETDTGEFTVGFSLGDEYDSTRELIIDPAVVIYSGFLGGAGMDAAADVAVDDEGAAYITGFTMSAESSFPAETGPDTTYNVARDAFVAKVRPDGGGLIYAGYIGGAGDDEGRSIAVDSQGNAYVVGSTASAAGDFPVAGGPDLTHNGATDAFIAKVNPAGTSLIYSGYIGGSGVDVGNAVALDSANAAYVAGTSMSADGSFPANVGPDLTFAGESDAFIAKVAPDGAELGYAGFIGGTGVERGMGVAVDLEGNAYVTGETSSSEASFPIVGGPDTTFNGAADTLDAFVAKVSADGLRFDYSGYIGGASTDSGRAIVVDSDGAAFVVGKTSSERTSFPVAGGPSLEFSGVEDAFLAKVEADGAGLDSFGYLGGTGMDGATGVALGPFGLVFVTGYTASTDFPAVAGLDATFNGITDAFVAAIAPHGGALLHSSFVGGADADSASGIAVDAQGNVYLAGETLSTEADFPTVVGPDPTANGASDGYVAKLSLGFPFFSTESIVNAASFSGGPIAPGEIISIFGMGLAAVGLGGIPPEGLGADLGPDGKLLSERGGTKVLFDGEPAPIYFVSERQINAQAPYSLFGKDTVTVRIETLDGMTPPVEVAVADSAPGLFTKTAGGEAVIAVNLNGSLNSESNPAAAGDILLFFATGEGQTQPPGETGKLAEPPLPLPLLPVVLTVDGAPAELLFAGAAPGFAGLMQINARLPELPASAALTGENAEQQPPIKNVVVNLGIGGKLSQQTRIFVIPSLTPPGQAPIALDDEVSTNQQTPVTVNVLANDSDPQGQRLTLIEVHSSTSFAGSFVFDPNGRITFTPNRNFEGRAVLRYVIEDTDGNRAGATLVIRVGALTDLRIEKTMVSATFTAGTTIEYRVSISNSGPSTAVDTTVTDRLPADLTFVAAGSSTECSAVGRLVTCGPATLGSGASRIFVIKAAIASSAAGLRTNTASVDQANDPDAPKSAGVTNMFDLRADLAITKTLNGAAVAGAQVSYTINVTNPLGPSDAPGATVDDVFPATLSSVTWTCAASGAGSFCPANGSGNLSSQSVDVGAGGSVTFTVTGTLDAAATGTLDNTAAVTSALDSNLGDNTAMSSDPIMFDVVLSATKNLKMGHELKVGQAADYIVAVNHVAGSSNANNVAVTDVLDAQLTFVPGGSSIGCTAALQTVTCTVATIPPLGSAMFTIQVMVN